MHKFISFLVLLHIACSNCILLSKYKTPLRCNNDEILLPTTEHICDASCNCHRVAADASRICVPTNYYFQGDLRYSEIHSAVTPKPECFHGELTRTFIPGQKTWHPSLPPPTSKPLGYYCNQPIEVFNPESTTQLLFTPLVNTPQSPPSTKFVTAKQNVCNCVEKCSCYQSGSRVSTTTRTVSYTQPVTTVTVSPHNESTAPTLRGRNIYAQPSPRTVVLYARSLNNPYQSPTWEPVVVDQSNQNIMYHCDDGDIQFINSYQDCGYNTAVVDDSQSDSVVTITVTSPSQYITTREPTCYCEDNIVATTITEGMNSIITVYPTTSIFSTTENITTTSSAYTVTVTVSNCNCSENNSTNGPVISTEGSNSTSCIVPPTGNVCLPLATLIKYNVSLVRVDDIPMDIVFNSSTTSSISTSTIQTLTVAKVCNGTTSIINTTTVPSTLVNPSSNTITCSSQFSSTSTSTVSSITSSTAISTFSLSNSTSTVSNNVCSRASSTVTQVVVTTVYPSNQTSVTYNAISVTTTSQPLKYCGISTTSSNQMIIVTNSAGQPVSRMNISVNEPIQCNAYLVVTWDPTTIPADAKYLDFYMRQGFAGKAVQVLSNYPLTKSNKEKSHIAIYVWNNPDLPSGSGYILQARAKNATSRENGVDLAVGWSQVFALPSCQSQISTNTASSQCYTSVTMPSAAYPHGAIKRKSCKPQSTVLYYGGTSPSNSRVVYVQN